MANGSVGLRLLLRCARRLAYQEIERARTDDAREQRNNSDQAEPAQRRIGRHENQPYKEQARERAHGAVAEADILFKHFNSPEYALRSWRCTHILRPENRHMGSNRSVRNTYTQSISGERPFTGKI